MTAVHTEILSDQRGYRKTAGERLRRARELKGLSQKDVANTLNLMVSHVRAIESNRYDVLAEGEHFGGYLRSYARLVDLDPQQIIDLYTSQSEDSGADTIVLSSVQAEQQSHFRPGISVGFFAVVCVAVAVWVAFRFGVFSGSDEEQPEVAVVQEEEVGVAKEEEVRVAKEQSSPPAPASNLAEVETKAVVKDEIVETDHSTDAATPDSAATEKQDREQKPVRDSVAAAGSIIRDTQTAGQTAVRNEQQDSTRDVLPSQQSLAAAAQARRERLATQATAERAANDASGMASNLKIQQRATRTDRNSSRKINREADRRARPSTPNNNNVAVAIGSDRLVLDFTTDCWVEIYDANGESLRLGVERAGDRLLLRGTAPFDVLVGFSRGVTITLNGEPVPIKQHQFSDSTHLVAGGPDDFFNTQQTYEDVPSVATNEPADKEQDSAIEDTVDKQPGDKQATDSQAADEELVDKQTVRDQQAIDKTPEPTTATAAVENRVSVPARYSRQFATPAPSTVDELEMAARQSNTRPDYSNEAQSSRRSDKTPLIRKQDELQFSFSEECWLEVYDAEKRPLVMDTKYAGETLELKGQGPFEVRVGNSRAVSLKVNGQKIEIKKDRYIGSTEFFVGSR